MEVGAEVEHGLLRRRDDVNGPGELAGLKQIGGGTCGKPPADLGGQIAGGLIHREDVEEHLARGGALRGPEDLGFALMGKALQLVLFVETHARRSPPRPMAPRPFDFSSNAFIFKRLPIFSVVS
ncbi:MAG: hypothetical protein IPJ98_30370 [Bryobacterales bacterium]|nr:hypothetical protein [Bryobacterales bacterium]